MNIQYVDCGVIQKNSLSASYQLSINVLYFNYIYYFILYQVCFHILTSTCNIELKTCDLDYFLVYSS